MRPMLPCLLRQSIGGGQLAGESAARREYEMPGFCFETRNVSADLTWLTFGANVSFALKKR